MNTNEKPNRGAARAYAIAGLLAIQAILFGVLSLAAIGLLLEALQ